MMKAERFLNNHLTLWLSAFHGEFIKPALGDFKWDLFDPLRIRGDPRKRKSRLEALIFAVKPP